MKRSGKGISWNKVGVIVGILASVATVFTAFYMVEQDQANKRRAQRDQLQLQINDLDKRIDLNDHDITVLQEDLKRQPGHR